jgi:hypothetical protein
MSQWPWWVVVVVPAIVVSYVRHTNKQEQDWLLRRVEEARQQQERHAEEARQQQERHDEALRRHDEASQHREERLVEDARRREERMATELQCRAEELRRRDDELARREEYTTRMMGHIAAQYVSRVLIDHGVQGTIGIPPPLPIVS